MTSPKRSCGDLKIVMNWKWCVCVRKYNPWRTRTTSTNNPSQLLPTVGVAVVIHHTSSSSSSSSTRHRDLPRHSSFSYYHITEQLQTNRNVCVEHPFCAFSSCLVDGAHRCPNRLRLNTQQDVVGRDVVVWLKECRYWPGTQTRMFLQWGRDLLN